jgi:hypothetical protein
MTDDDARHVTTIRARQHKVPVWQWEWDIRRLLLIIDTLIQERDSRHRENLACSGRSTLND